MQVASMPFLVRRLRLATGLVLFFYVTTHLLNHTLGLISVDALEWGRHYFLLLWGVNPLATPVLYGALLIHFLLALWAIYQRRRLRMPAGEAAQLLLGIAIIPMLTRHVVGTRLAFEYAGVNDSYT